MTGDNPNARYREAVAIENRALDARLANIRRRVDAGEYTTRQAADERVRCLTEHLAELQRLRARHLGSEAAPEPEQVPGIPPLPDIWTDRDPD